MKHAKYLCCVFLCLWLVSCDDDSEDIKGTSEGGPTEPRDIQLRAYDEALEVRWQPPASQGESEIIRYEYDLNGLGKWRSMGTRSPYTLEGLENDQIYMVRIRAVNSDAQGEVSRGVFLKPSPYGRSVSQRDCRSRGRGDNSRDPYVICTYEDLRTIHNYFRLRNGVIKGAYIALGNHIDATPSFSQGVEGCIAFDGKNENDFNICRGWEPLPHLKDVHIYGRGHVIFGLYSSRTESSRTGLISRVSDNSIIRDLHLRQAFVKGHIYESYVGGIVGEADSGSVIENSSVAGGWVVGENVVGGVVGEMRNAFAVNVYVAPSSKLSLEIQGRVVGGIAGRVGEGSSIHSAFSKANIQASTSSSNEVYGGGIVGRIGEVSYLSYSVSESSVTSAGYAGSVLGFAGESSQIEDNLGAGRVSSNATSKEGGFCGGMEASVSQRNNFWDKESTGQVTDRFLKPSRSLTTSQAQSFCESSNSSPVCSLRGDAFVFSSEDYPKPSFCLRFCSLKHSNDSEFISTRGILERP